MIETTDWDGEHPAGGGSALILKSRNKHWSGVSFEEGGRQ